MTVARETRPQTHVRTAAIVMRDPLETKRGPQPSETLGLRDTLEPDHLRARRQLQPGCDPCNLASAAVDVGRPLIGGF